MLNFYDCFGFWMIHPSCLISLGWIQCTNGQLSVSHSSPCAGIGCSWKVCIIFSEELAPWTFQASSGWWFGTCWNLFFDFTVYLEQSSQLTFILFRGVEPTNQSCNWNFGQEQGSHPIVSELWLGLGHLATRWWIFWRQKCQLASQKWAATKTPMYPPAMTNITMENHHFQWEKIGKLTVIGNFP